MINESLDFICSQMNEHFKKQFDVAEEKAIVSNIINVDGSVPIQNNDKLVISLANIEQETSIANLGFTHKQGNEYQLKNQPLSINLYILFAANFSNYSESLKFVSATISFFQANYLFTQKDYPQLSNISEKLVFELLKTDYQNVYNIWNAIGAKYLPSVIYKMRMLVINNDNTLEKINRINQINWKASPINKKNKKGDKEADKGVINSDE